MKRYITSLTLLITGLITVSCGDMLNTDIPENIDYIKVITSVDTKAGYEGTSLLPSEFVMDINQGEEGYYDYSLVKMTKESDSNTYAAPEEVTLRWADPDHSKAYIKAITIPYGVEDVDGVNSMVVKVLKDQTTAENVKNSDFLGAESNNGIIIDGNYINISFNHLMTKLHVTYSIKDELKSRNISVNSISLENACVGGGFNYDEMDYDDNVEKMYDNIDMYHNSSEKTAECIFYPNLPVDYPVLAISITVDGKAQELSIPVAIKDKNGFIAGKRYEMNITISGSGVRDSDITLVNEWSKYGEIGTLTNDKILWVGTSISSGEGDNNYPKMISDITGIEIINNSIPGAFVTFDPNCNVTTADQFNATYAQGFSLSATHEEVENKYRPVLPNIPGIGYEYWIDLYKSTSYESLIIPYIDGTVDDCNILIIDHGFNDRFGVIAECNGHIKEGELPIGKSWLQDLIDNNGNGYAPFEHLGKLAYIPAMQFVIEECLKVRPDLKIIIGNYFASRIPAGVDGFDATGLPYDIGGRSCMDLVLMSNQAVASMYGLDIVDVYKYTGLDNDTDFHNYWLFANDFVHPHSGGNILSNRVIANAYVEELGRILCK